VDLLETAESYLLYAELPGVRRQDIELEVLDGALELTGTRQPLEEGRSFMRMERSYGPFRRRFALAQSVDPEAVRASFERGILKVEIPKRRARTIAVRAAEEG
jgi:HSP20 family protein